MIKVKNQEIIDKLMENCMFSEAWARVLIWHPEAFDMKTAKIKKINGEWFLVEEK